MPIKKRVEEIYDDGRKKTIVEEVDEQGHSRVHTTEEPLLAGPPETRSAEPGRFEDRRDTETIGEEEVVQYHSSPWMVVRGWIRMLGMLVIVALAVVEALLAFRLGFQLAAANPNNDFVSFIYRVTGQMVSPFEGIASNQSVGGGGVFEPATAIAMIVFLVAGLILVGILWALSATPSPEGE